MTDSCPDAAPDTIEANVRAKYRRVAEKASGHFPYPVGRRSLERLGYPAGWLDGVPSEVIDRFVGVGNPFAIRRPEPGERVLDVGCGCGLDALVAAHLVGPTGRVVGVDLTPEMLDVARSAVPSHLSKVVTFLEASILRLPFEDGSFDLALSNGVLNLVPDKDAAFREICRVLRTGATLAIVDLLVVEAVPKEILEDPAAWAT